MRTTTQVAAEFGCSNRHVRALANRLGVGMNLGGRAGFRFTDQDVDKIREALRPRPIQRRRRSA